MTPREEWHLGTAHLGRRVLLFDSLDSTSSHAAALAADPNNAGLVVMADTQTAGRGQQGHSWLCPDGMGILMSVLLFPPAAVRRPALLTAWAAVSVCETIQRTTGLRPTIKWPNDVLIHGRKVCGILIEQARGTVVGIGLNVLQSADSFAAAGLPQAGSLAVFTDRPLDRREVTRQLLGVLDEGYGRLCAGDLAQLEADWASGLGLVDRRVTVECSAAVHSGLLLDIAFDGLTLAHEDGRMLRLLPEEVRHVQTD